MLRDAILFEMVHLALLALKHYLWSYYWIVKDCRLQEVNDFKFSNSLKIIIKKNKNNPTKIPSEYCMTRSYLDCSTVDDMTFFVASYFSHILPSLYFEDKVLVTVPRIFHSSIEHHFYAPLWTKKRSYKFGSNSGIIWLWKLHFPGSQHRCKNIFYEKKKKKRKIKITLKMF